MEWYLKVLKNYANFNYNYLKLIMTQKTRRWCSLWTEDSQGYQINKFTLACADREANQAINAYNLERINRYIEVMAAIWFILMLPELADFALPEGTSNGLGLTFIAWQLAFLLLHVFLKRVYPKATPLMMICQFVLIAVLENMCVYNLHFFECKSDLQSSIIVIFLDQLQFIIFANLFAYDYRIVLFVGAPINIYNISNQINELYENLTALGSDGYEVASIMFVLFVVFYLTISLFIYQTQFNYAKLVV